MDPAPLVRVTVEETRVIRTSYLIAVPDGEDPIEQFHLHQVVRGAGEPAPASRETIRGEWGVVDVAPAG